MKRSTLILLSILALLVSTGFTCSKEDAPADPNPPGSASGVYVAYSTGSQHFDRIAKYWHDGKDSILMDRTSKVYVSDVAVAANGDVYTSGCECTYSRYPLTPNQKDDSCKITLWKNRVRQQLTQDPFSSITEAYVSVTPAGDVYVAGTERDPLSGAGIIRLWKNGIRSDISNASKDAEVTSLYVNGNDVYIGGNQKTIGVINTTATLWKNGVPQSLSAATSYFDAVLSIQVSGSDVYAAIQEGGNGFVVKNGTKLSQPSGIQYIRDIFLSGNDLYVLGKPTITTTAVWKNGTLLHNLTYTGYSDFYDGGQGLFVKDGNVYVSGATLAGSNYNAVIWKNGSIINTIDQPGNYSLTEAKAIVVK